MPGFRWLALAGWLVVTSLGVQATPMVKTPALVLAFSPLPPWKVVDAAGRPSGPYLVIAQRLAQRLKVPLKVQVCPLLRCLELLRRGEVDIALGVAPGPGRDEYVDYLQPAFAEGSTVGFYRRSGDKVSVASHEELAALRIGTTIGAHYFPRFDQDNTLQKDYAPDKLSNLRKLLVGRVDVVIMVSGEANVLLSRPEFQHKVQLAGPPVVTGPRSIVLSRRSRARVLKPRMEAALRQMVASGEIRHILRPVEH